MRVPTIFWPPVVFSRSVYRHIEMIMLPTNCASLKRSFKIKTAFVSMEIQQPDLALCRDALDSVSEEAFQMLCSTSLEADVTESILPSFAT